MSAHISFDRKLLMQLFCVGGWVQVQGGHNHFASFVSIMIHIARNFKKKMQKNKNTFSFKVCNCPSWGLSPTFPCTPAVYYKNSMNQSPHLKHLLIWIKVIYYHDGFFICSDDCINAQWSLSVTWTSVTICEIVNYCTLVLWSTNGGIEIAVRQQC